MTFFGPNNGLKKIIPPFILDEKAQTMAEFAVLVSFCVITFVGLWALWSGPLRAYYDRIAVVIVLPQP